jgi:hypothetical protein
MLHVARTAPETVEDLQDSAATHPSAASRSAYLQRALIPVLEEAEYVLTGFSAAIREIAEYADLDSNPGSADTPLIALAGS